jgi:RNA polymerase sigma-70 factor (ECF subfamily)
VRLALIARGIRADRARDFAQGAWAKLWQRQLEGRLPRLELPGLAIRQALFLAGDERRSRREETGEDGLELADAGLEDRLASREQLAQIEGELGRCPANMQRIFFLAHGGEGLSHAEVAERTGLSVQRVRQTLCELRARLRTLLEEEP